MPPSKSPTVSVLRLGHGCVRSDPHRTVVWVRGGHDAATSEKLSVTLAHAATLDDADIVVDLSGVTFMDASTIGALVGAGDHLRDLSRSLSVRDPSPSAWRVLSLCGLVQLIDENPAPMQPPVTALGSWVDVPARHRDPDFTQPPTAKEVPHQAAAHATVRRGVAPAGSAQQGRALW